MFSMSNVEGVSWNVKRTEAGQYVPTFPHDGECVSSICVCKPLPHAWNVVNGHVVDLQGEFYNWRFPGSEYLHEPLKVYSLEDIPVGGVSGSILQKVWMEEHPGLANPNRAAICQHVFKDASDRLIQRVDSLPEGRREMTAELFYSRVPCRYPLPCISPEPSAQDYVMSLPEMQRRTALSFGRL